MSLIKDKIELKIEETELEAQKVFGRYPPALRFGLIVILLLIIPSYFISKAIANKTSGSSLRQQQAAAKPSFTDPLPLKNSPVQVAYLDNGVYSAAVLAENPNLELSLPNVNFEARFYGSGGELAQTISGNAFFQPNQKKYLAIPKIQSAIKISRAELAFEANPKWQRRMMIPQVAIISPNPELSATEDINTLSAEGAFKNNSPYGLRQTRLVFLLLGPDGNFLASSQRDEFSIKPYETRSYKQLWPNLDTKEAVSVHVQAETNTLSKENLSHEGTEASSPASSLDRPQAD